MTKAILGLAHPLLHPIPFKTTKRLRLHLTGESFMKRSGCFASMETGLHLCVLKVKTEDSHGVLNFQVRQSIAKVEDFQLISSEQTMGTSIVDKPAAMDRVFDVQN